MAKQSPYITVDRSTQSSAVSKLRWNPKTGTLGVTFRGGKTYTYTGVTRQRWQAVLKAKSVGGYVNRNLKPAVGSTARRVVRAKGSILKAMSRTAGSSTSNS